MNVKREYVIYKKYMYVYKVCLLEVCCSDMHKKC